MIIGMNQTDSALSASNAESLSAFASSGFIDSQEQRHTLDYLEMGAGGGSTAVATTQYIQGNHSGFNATNFNGTSGGMPAMDPVLIERFLRNRSIDGPWYHLLIAMYSVLIVFGALGNVLVVIAVLRKPIMRTARNLFILNLAISDLLLCLVTMPLTLMEILSKFWPFGSCAILCKMIAMLQALSIFVSTISITAIAFDRYQVIVYPTRDSLQFVGAVTILAGIWLLALLLASPMFIFKRLVNTDTPLLLQRIGFQDTLSFCIEDWPLNHGRFYYSIFSLCVQYLVPILIVSVAYFGIYNKLKNRITVVTVQASTQRKVERGRRMKRTNCLLISIAIIFGVSWLPLNFFNLYADMRRSVVTQGMLVAYAICHMIGMSSACSNPLLYGWLNDNFRSSVQAAARRRRKQGADISKGELRLLGSVAGGGGGDFVGGAAGSDGDAACRDYTTTACSMGHNIYGLRSAVTESVALTENPMPSEMTTLMPRPNVS
ncbi:neuropeptide F receptor [Scaptodrosophila lebanonensis]|uniref:Neuropeptide F receptor n=1 Tax=Drosophila lebanonensis TaxID=7225 RepID=A0A6J2T4E6_DROLE|nr:neuropeptide F receptor [Scaptodrosophila lebanonensis]